MDGLHWWKQAVFYQIYLPSFADGSGGGMGDLMGVVQHLDYLQDLGIDAIWLSPHYPSPMHDCGYDIADYTAVGEQFGTMADFRRLLQGAHQRGIRLVLDLVLNHTSDQHPWFIESRQSRSNPKRDWYVWRSGKHHRSPNNWVSRFGGSAWEYDPITGQYYYHYFFKQQPDLNWRNPEVKEAMWDVVRFWLDMGVDGFRLDAISQLLEHPDWREHQSEVSLAALNCGLITAEDREERQRLAAEKEALLQHQGDQSGIHEILQELRAIVDQYDDRVLVGETYKPAYYGDGTNELHMVFNFPLMRAECLFPSTIRDNQRERLAALPPEGWPCNTLNNHDSPRAVSRYHTCGHGTGACLARLCISLLLTLKGTPFLYQGEEIGMTDLELDDPAQFRDRISLWIYHAAIEELEIEPSRAMGIALRFGRDRARTPMQWTAGPNAGFSPAGVETWLPVNPNYRSGINVSDQRDDPDSMLEFYRGLLRVRKENPALIAGAYEPLPGEAREYLAFLRRSETPAQTCLVVLNMSARLHTLDLPQDLETIELVFSSHRRRSSDQLSELRINPFEVYIGEIA
jgi:alpha-glucosidase